MSKKAQLIMGRWKKAEAVAESKPFIAFLCTVVLSLALFVHTEAMDHIESNFKVVTDHVLEIKADQKSIRKEQKTITDKYTVDLRYETDKIYAETEGLDIRIRNLELKGQ